MSLSLPRALQGGYNLDATATSVAACVRVLLGERPPALGTAPPVAPSPAAQATIREVIGIQVRTALTCAVGNVREVGTPSIDPNSTPSHQP